MFQTTLLIATLFTSPVQAGEPTACTAGEVTWNYAQPVNDALLCANAAEQCPSVAPGAKCQISLSAEQWSKWTGELDEVSTSTLKDALLRIGDDFSFTQNGHTIRGVIRIEQPWTSKTP